MSDNMTDSDTEYSDIEITSVVVHDTAIHWRKCYKCFKWLECDKFYYMKDVCKVCHIKGVKISRKKFRDKYNAKAREYNKKIMLDENKRLERNRKARERYHARKEAKKNMLVST